MVFRNSKKSGLRAVTHNTRVMARTKQYSKSTGSVIVAFLLTERLVLRKNYSHIMRCGNIKFSHGTMVTGCDAIRQRKL